MTVPGPAPGYKTKFTDQTLDAAEPIVLASILTGMAEIPPDLTADHFFYDGHKIVFNGILAVRDKDQPVDTFTVYKEISSQLPNSLELINGIIDSSAPRTNLSAYLSTIYAAYAERLDARNRAELAAMVGSGCTPAEMIAFIEKMQEVGKGRPGMPPPMAAMIPSEQERSAARLTPTCIVKDYIYADVQTWAAPGGTGKTTISIYEAICLVLRRPIHGMTVEKPGWVLFITAEDRREQLIARIREMIRAMCLSADLEELVWERVLIWDVTGEQQRLVSMQDGNIVLTSMADDIVRAYQKNPPILVVFDPAISFGVSESFVNDNENAIVIACRRIVKGLDCCVRIIAHTGKANAREGTLDQYSSRGGSALADGSRMVSVLQAWSAGNPLRPPPGCFDDEGVSIVILARPKLSYSPPKLPIIWIRRKGWIVESFLDVKVTKEEQDKLDQEKILEFLGNEVAAGKRHTKTTLETLVPGMSRSKARTAIATLMVNGKILEAELPPEEQVTKRKTYLITSAGFGSITQKAGGADAEKNPLE